MPLVLKPASIDVSETLAALHARSFGAEKWSRAQIEGSLALPSTEGTVAFLDEKPAGFLLAQIMDDEAEILTLCVDPDFRRGGIGATLVRKLTARGGMKRVFLEVADDNQTAQKLYEKCGFARQFVRAGYYKRENAAMDAITYCFSRHL